MDNFYVLFGLNVSAKYDENEVDDCVRLLTDKQLYALSRGRTLIRQMFAEPSCRNEMRSAFAKDGALFTAEYRKEDHKLYIRSELPSCYGEFTVYTSAERFETGVYEHDSVMMNECREVGVTEIGEDDLPYSVITPSPTDKYYYPAVKLSVCGAGKCYIIGCEENRAFVRNMRTSYSYESVTAAFDWGKFSRAFYILASEDGGGLPEGRTATLLSVSAQGERGKAVGIIRGRIKLRNISFVEETDTGKYVVLEESKI